MKKKSGHKKNLTMASRLGFEKNAEDTSRNSKIEIDLYMKVFKKFTILKIRMKISYMALLK